MDKHSKDSDIHHRVMIVVPESVVLLDLAVPMQVFGPWPEPVSSRLGIRHPYAVNLVDGGAGSIGHFAPTGAMVRLDELEHADTIIVPGVADPTAPIAAELIEALRAAHGRGARLASICTGAFALAAAGILDGRRATTHWYWADELRRRHPRVIVDEQHLYLEDQGILSSGGILAGTDLCLHMLRADCGIQTANLAARFLVSAPFRDGGQAQFRLPRALPPDHELAPVLAWIDRHLEEPISAEDVARVGCASTRTMARRFRANLGQNLSEWVAGQRIARAQSMLETTDLPVSDIAHRCGFGSAESMRQHFHARLLCSPTRYRRTFAGRGQPAIPLPSRG